MKNLLSITASIGEMDTAYIVIAFIAIIVLWVLFKMLSKKKE